MVKVLECHKTLPYTPRAILTLHTPLTLGAARRCDDQLCKVSQAIPAQQVTYLAALIIISRSYQLQHGPRNFKDCLAVEARHCYIRKTTYKYLTHTHTCMLPSLVPSWQRLLPSPREICFCRSQCFTATTMTLSKAIFACTVHQGLCTTISTMQYPLVWTRSRFLALT